MSIEQEGFFGGGTPDEIIASFEARTAVPGQNTYEVRPQPGGKGETVVKIKPSGEEVHVDVSGSSTSEG